VIKISLYNGNLFKGITKENLKIIRKKINKKKFLNVQNIGSLIENKIFKKKNKFNCKIYKL